MRATTRSIGCGSTTSRRNSSARSSTRHRCCRPRRPTRRPQPSGRRRDAPASWPAASSHSTPTARSTKATFAFAGRVFVADLASGDTRQLESEGSVFDPRFDPTATRVAYVSGATLRVTGDDGDRLVIGEDHDNVSWGSAEFVAAEEMHRTRGYWWAPDGDRLLVERVDVSPVPVWHIASPIEPWVAPATVRYPAAGTDNATSVTRSSGLDGSRVDIDWSRASSSTCATCRGRRGRSDVGRTDAGSTHTGRSRGRRGDGRPAKCAGFTSQLDRPRAGRARVVGHPARHRRGRRRHLSTVRRGRADDAHRCAGAPRDLRRRSRGAHRRERDPTEMHVARVDLESHEVQWLSDRPGVHGGTGGGDVVALVSQSMDHDGSAVAVLVGGQRRGVLRTFAERRRSSRASSSKSSAIVNSVRPSCCHRTSRATSDCPCCSIRMAARDTRAWSKSRSSPTSRRNGSRIRVRGRGVDGRGTPGRGPSWERAVRDDLAGAGDRRPGRRAGRVGRAHPSSICRRSASAAGRSVATSRRWRCCAGPTCSTPR